MGAGIWRLSAATVADDGSRTFDKYHQDSFVRTGALGAFCIFRAGQRESSVEYCSARSW